MTLPEELLCFSLSPDGNRVATGSRALRVFNLSTGAEVMTMRGHNSIVSAVAFSPDGQRIVSGSWDKTVKVWDAGTGKELITLGEHDGIILCVAFSPDGRRVISAGLKAIKLWDTASPEELAVSFSP
jgi:WD40 repeat protein